jgi:hypothetical protein
MRGVEGFWQVYEAENLPRFGCGCASPSFTFLCHAVAFVGFLFSIFYLSSRFYLSYLHLHSSHESPEFGAAVLDGGLDVARFLSSLLHGRKDTVVFLFGDHGRC